MSVWENFTFDIAESCCESEGESHSYKFYLDKKIEISVVSIQVNSQLFFYIILFTKYFSVYGEKKYDDFCRSVFLIDRDYYGDIYRSYTRFQAFASIFAMK